MSSSLAVMRRACLVLGLLMPIGGSGWAQCTCTPGSPPPTPTSCNPFNFEAFGTVALGSSLEGGYPFILPSAGIAVSSSIVGPNAGDFAIIPGGTCTPRMPSGQDCFIIVRFTPAACGLRVAFLLLTLSQPRTGSCTLIIPLTGIGTFTPVVGPTLNFPSTLAGTTDGCVTLTKPANVTASIVGPGNFTITAQTDFSVTVCFTPLAAACGTVTSTLTSTLIFTSDLTNCPLATFNLSGFAFSFECAIGLAGSPSLSAAGRKCILDSLQIAANSTGLTRCAALRCAECCAKSEAASTIAARRAAALLVLAQIQGLEAFFGCAPFPC